MEKALGLDLGKKTLGIAYSDSLGFCHPVETFRFNAFDYKTAAEHTKQVLNERGVKVVALGLPLHLSGEMSEMGQNVMNFKQLLLELVPGLTVELIDERLTSVQANNTLSFLDVSHQKRKDNVDALAAVEILESYIRSKQYK